MKRKAAAVGLAASAALVLSILSPLAAQAATVAVTVDFATDASYPLVKSKFGVYTSGYVTPARWVSDAPKLQELRPARVRWEMMMGNEQPGWSPMVTGTAAAPVYDFAQADQVIDVINSADGEAVVNLTYTPAPLQPTGGSWNDPPTDFTTWAEVGAAFASHWKSTDRPIGSYDIHNEPDLAGVFWSGTQSQYLDLFGRTATAIRDVDPDAYIEGPALCCVSWQSAFTTYVAANDLPLDGFSFHRYGNLTSDDVNTDYRGATDSGVVPYRFSTVENNLNEYNWTNDFVAPTEVTTYQSASQLLRSFKAALEKPWITHVEWAQFQDPVCPTTCDVIGLVDQAGHRRAAYNAFLIYSRMPIDRKAFSASSGIDGMASTDSTKSSVVLWNTSDTTQTVDAALDNVPFATGDMRVYRIDETHSSYGDDPANELLTPVSTTTGASTAGLTWSGTIPADGVVYIEVDDGSGTDELSPVSVATDIKDLTYDPTHSKLSWGSFDHDLWQAELGMGPENFADEAAGVFASDIPDTLRVRYVVSGTPLALDANSLLGMRVDYETSGGFAKSVLWHGGLYDPSRSAPYPYGTNLTAPTTVISVPDLSDFTADIAGNAPSGWNGRATIVFQMQNTGSGTSASVRVTTS